MPMEGSCVVVALRALNSTSKPLNVSPEKSQILSCDPVVANERYVISWYRCQSQIESLLLCKMQRWLAAIYKQYSDTVWFKHFSSGLGTITLLTANCMECKDGFIYLFVINISMAAMRKTVTKV